MPGTVLGYLRFIALQMEKTHRIYAALIYGPNPGSRSLEAVINPERLPGSPPSSGWHLARTFVPITPPGPSGRPGRPLCSIPWYAPYPASRTTHNWGFPYSPFVRCTFLRKYTPDPVFLSTNHHFLFPHRPSLNYLYCL